MAVKLREESSELANCHWNGRRVTPRLSHLTHDKRAVRSTIKEDNMLAFSQFN